MELTEALGQHRGSPADGGRGLRGGIRGGAEAHPGGDRALARLVRACGWRARLRAPALSYLRPFDAMTHGRFADVAAAHGPEGGDVGGGVGGGVEGRPKNGGSAMNLPWTGASAAHLAAVSLRPPC